MCTSKRRWCQTGFTLVELIIFIVVVSVGAVGILAVMNESVGRSADPMLRKQAAVLADSILEEVLLKAYCDPDPLLTSGETTRTTMDDVSDFASIVETIETATVFTGMPPALNKYKIEIGPVVTTVLGAVPAKQVGVTVTAVISGESVGMVGYRTRYGAQDRLCP